MHIPRPRRAVVIAAAAALALLAVSPATAGEGRPGRSGHPVVDTASGQLRGVSVDGADRFLGIPYAAPPVKDLRFSPPQPVEEWSGVRDATRQAPACLQFQPTGVREDQAVSEDCLHLDVYRPSGARPDAELPVLVWFHGGGWTQGSGVIYGGQTMASMTDSVVISINYRLGALGWLALPQLDSEQPLTESGNYGTLDQIQALEWVQENIAGLGGDADNVTVFGQSAGGGAVCSMLASPLAAGLFDRAIIQSLGCARGQNAKATAEQTGQEFAEAAGCADPATVVDCLRTAWAPDLIAAGQEVVVRASTYGTPVLPQLPLDAIEDGTWNEVPVLIGGVRAEGKLFVIDSAGIGAAGYEERIRSQYGADADAVLAEYPASAYREPFYALAAVSTDSGIACAVNGTADALAEQDQAVYRYEFDDPTSPTLYGFQPPGIDMSNAHSAELAYLFDFTLGHRPLTAQEEALSLRMMSYWVAFARNGDPNVPGLPSWPPYTTDAPRTLVLSPTGETVRTDVAEQHNCAFWSQLQQ